MSLLLDALQRASKDKEKAAAAAGSSPSPLSPPAPVQVPTEPELTLSDKDPAPTSLPTLVQELVVPVPSEVVPAKALSLEPPQEMSLDFTPTPPPVPQTPKAAPQHSPNPVGAQVPAPAPVAAPGAEPVLELRGAVSRPSVAAPSMGRTAQDIRRAYMVDDGPRKGRRRTLIIVGLVVALAVVLVGLYLKTMQGMSPPLAPVAAPAPDVVPVVAAPVGSVPVASSVSVNTAVPVPPDIEPLAAKKMHPTQATPQPSGNATGSAAAALAQGASTSVVSSAAAPSASGAASDNEVVLEGGNVKQSFVSRIRGPSPLELGYSALLAGRLDDATQQYTQALKANSEERDALLGLAYIAQKKGQSDDAQALYRRVLRQEPGNAIAAAALLALDTNSDSGQTASRARELALRQPDSAATMAMAGNAAVRDGLLADAVQLFARAQYLEPNNPLYAYNHAVALDRLGQFSSAATQYEKVIKLSDNPASAVGRAYSVDAVKERLTQLRQALNKRTETAK